MTGKKSNKHTYTCPYCGSNFYSNILNNHLRFKCTAPEKDKKYWLNLFTSHSKRDWCWLIADGKEATRINNWRPLAFINQLDLADVTFTSPRAKGVMRPSQANKMGMDRKGRNNPASKAAPKYSYQKIEEVMTSALNNWFEDSELYRRQSDFLKSIDIALPQWRHSCADLDFGFKKRSQTHPHLHALISYFTKVPVEEYKKWITGIKSKRIIAGVLGTYGRYLISKPEQALFDRVKQYDPSATQQYEATLPNNWKCAYDIYSPLANCVIEMHGRTWHDPEKASKKLKEIARKHQARDKIKEQLAIDLGMQYLVFWDDEQDKWESKLNEYFKNQIS